MNGRGGRRLIVIGPVPPPIHGVAVSTELVLANPILGERFRVEHLDTSDHRSGANLGRWDLVNITLALKHEAQLLRRLRGADKGVVYLPVSQNAAGFLRDSLFIVAAVAARWRVAGHLRGSEFREFYSGRGRIFRWWIRRTIRRLDSLALMGTTLRPLFDGILPPEKIAVVPNGTPDLEPGQVPSASTQVLFLSNLRRRKGVVESLEAALLVTREDPEVDFLFVGAWEDDELAAALRERARGADGRIRFRQPTAGEEEKRRLLLSSALLLFPPVEPEGHPRVVLEAMSAGLPVVTTDRGAIAETVVDGETGFVLPQPVPGELADRVLRLLRDQDLRHRMATAARERYLSVFTQERADQCFADWLEDVLRSVPAVDQAARARAAS